jgi:hypothetical protein
VPGVRGLAAGGVVMAEDSDRPRLGCVVPDPGAAPEGYRWVAVRAAAWRPVNGGRCRRKTSAGMCRADAVAALNRGRWSNHRRVPSWWRYCADHMYGKWIEDGKVMQWILRERTGGTEMINKNDTDKLVDEIMYYADNVRSWVRIPKDDVQAAALELADRVKRLDDVLTDGAPWPAMWTQVDRG